MMIEFCEFDSLLWVKKGTFDKIQSILGIRLLPTCFHFAVIPRKRSSNPDFVLKELCFCFREERRRFHSFFSFFLNKMQRRPLQNSALVREFLLIIFLTPTLSTKDLLFFEGDDENGLLSDFSVVVLTSWASQITLRQWSRFRIDSDSTFWIHSCAHLYDKGCHRFTLLQKKAPPEIAMLLKNGNGCGWFRSV